MEILVNTYLQISGKPKENVEKALEVIKTQLEKDNRMKILNYEILEPELDDKEILYSGLLDLELEFYAVKDVLAFVYDYLPMSIEIQEPESLKLNLSDFNSIVNDMSSKTMALTNENRQLKAYIHHLNKKEKLQEKEKEDKKEE